MADERVHNRLRCYLCGKIISSELPVYWVLRGVVVCVECWHAHGLPVRPPDLPEPPDEADAQAGDYRTLTGRE